MRILGGSEYSPQRPKGWAFSQAGSVSCLLVPNISEFEHEYLRICVGRGNVVLEQVGDAQDRAIRDVSCRSIALLVAQTLSRHWSLMML